MFKKKASLKPYAPLRSSDRRKLAASIINDFNLSSLPSATPTATEEVVAEAAPIAEGETSTNAQSNAPDPALTALRNALLPESTSSAKFTTTLGPDLHPVHGIIYSGVHPSTASSSSVFSDGKTVRPLWVKTDDEWFPTVYTCWEAAEYGLLPLVYTHGGVMERVVGGADLMMPGIIGMKRKGGGGVKKGECVGVVDYQNENVVLAVGIAEVDISPAGGRNEKGRGVRILHWAGDELWSLGGSGVAPPEKLNAAWNDAQSETDNGGVKLEALTLEDGEDAGESSRTAAGAPAEIDDDDDEPQFPEMKTHEIDAAFRFALIYAFYETLNSPNRPPNLDHAYPFPCASSWVLTELIKPKLPNAANPQYSIQKTSWKKVQKMLKAMDKEDLIKIKERSGDVFVYAVNWDCSAIRNFVPYPIIKPKAKKKKVEDAGVGTSASGSAGGNVKVLELYKPTAKVGAIYDITETSTKDFYTASQIREILYKYFTSPAPSDPSETLVSPNNARIIALNPTISNLLLDQSIPSDIKVLQAKQATRDFLAERFVRLHNPYWSIQSPSGETSKPKSGPIPKITITLESRQGKKTMTKVKGMEVFGVDVAHFVEELKSVAASSVTTGKVEGGGKAAEGYVEVLCQGDKATVVEGLLAKVGIRKADIILDNKLKKGKK